MDSRGLMPMAFCIFVLFLLVGGLAYFSIRQSGALIALRTDLRSAREEIQAEADLRQELAIEVRGLTEQFDKLRIQASDVGQLMATMQAGYDELKPAVDAAKARLDALETRKRPVKASKAAEAFKEPKPATASLMVVPE